MINEWSASVWESYHVSREDVVALIHAELG
jgi:hypothetical protein